ncbi:MAG: FixH family protein [Thermodesulfovibrionia bacterium]|nr:FixH family protein [Thermodesulfovibrionia bacterium]
MRTVMLTIFLFLIHITSYSVFATHPHTDSNGKHQKHMADSTMLTTEKGLYSVEMSIPEKSLKVGVNTVDLIIHDKNDRVVTGAEITFTPWMPEMEHGVFEEPVIVEKGSGLYRIENIILVMSGHWEIRINVKKGNMIDKIVFDFPDIRKMDYKQPHMDHTPKHGGTFFMAPNKKNHIEGVYSKERGFQLYIYDEFTQPISVIGFQAFIKMEAEEIDHILFLSPTKDHMILQSPLIEGHHSDLNLEGAFEIELYLKFPGENIPELFNFD